MVPPNIGFGLELHSYPGKEPEQWSFADNGEDIGGCAMVNFSIPIFNNPD